MNWPDLSGGGGGRAREPTAWMSQALSHLVEPQPDELAAVFYWIQFHLYSAQSCVHLELPSQSLCALVDTHGAFDSAFYCNFLRCRVHSIKLDSWSRITCVTPCNLIPSVLQPRPCISGVWSPPRATSFPSQTTSSPSKMMERSTASRWAGNSSRKWLRALSCCRSIFPSSRPFWDNYFSSCALAWLQLLFRRKKKHLVYLALCL